jgi:hypothetical protein
MPVGDRRDRLGVDMPVVDIRDRFGVDMPVVDIRDRFGVDMPVVDIPDILGVDMPVVSRRVVGRLGVDMPVVSRRVVGRLGVDMPVVSRRVVGRLGVDMPVVSRWVVGRLVVENRRRLRQVTDKPVGDRRLARSLKIQLSLGCREIVDWRVIVGFHIQYRKNPLSHAAPFDPVWVGGVWLKFSGDSRQPLEWTAPPQELGCRMSSEIDCFG